MMRCFFILLCFIFLTACDDGDILTVELEFDKELERCDNDVDSYLLYDTRTDPNESLTLLLPRTNQVEAFFTTPTVDDSPETLTIDGNTIRFNYRSYNSNPDGSLCDVLSNPDLIIREDYEANSGSVQVTVTIIDDDNDGIPSADENQDPNGDGDFSDAQDWDSDGIPDYLDEDDDNDNVKTINEIDDVNEDGDDDPTTNPKNTDLDLPNGDDIPDYLDSDDDGDGIDTRLEDANGENGPFDDIVVNTEGINIARYLYNEAVDVYPDPGPISNIYSRSVTTHFEILNAGLEIINSTYIDFGIFESSFNINSEDD